MDVGYWIEFALFVTFWICISAPLAIRRSILNLKKYAKRETNQIEMIELQHRIQNKKFILYMTQYGILIPLSWLIGKNPAIAFSNIGIAISVMFSSITGTCAIALVNKELLLIVLRCSIQSHQTNGASLQTLSKLSNVSFCFALVCPFLFETELVTFIHCF